MPIPSAPSRVQAAWHAHSSRPGPQGGRRAHLTTARPQTFSAAAPGPPRTPARAPSASARRRPAARRGRSASRRSVARTPGAAAAKLSRPGRGGPSAQTWALPSLPRPSLSPPRRPPAAAPRQMTTPAASSRRQQPSPPAPVTQPIATPGSRSASPRCLTQLTQADQGHSPRRSSPRLAAQVARHTGSLPGWQPGPRPPAPATAAPPPRRVPAHPGRVPAAAQGLARPRRRQPAAKTPSRRTP